MGDARTYRMLDPQEPRRSYYVNSRYASQEPRIIDLLTKTTMSCHEIADTLNVSQSVVTRISTHYGLRKKGPAPQ